jgi:hypothetical protein
MSARWIFLVLSIWSTPDRHSNGRKAGQCLRMSIESPLWGAPRIHGELLKLGFEVAQSSVAKYLVKRRGPPSQGWSTFLRNHLPEVASMDLFVVPTIGFATGPRCNCRPTNSGSFATLAAIRRAIKKEPRRLCERRGPRQAGSVTVGPSKPATPSHCLLVCAAGLDTT